MVGLVSCTGTTPVKPDYSEWKTGTGARYDQPAAQKVLRLYPEYKRLEQIIKSYTRKHVMASVKRDREVLNRLFLLYKRDALNLVSKLRRINTGSCYRTPASWRLTCYTVSPSLKIRS
jgi:hypothetical protein